MKLSHETLIRSSSKHKRAKVSNISTREELHFKKVLSTQRWHQITTKGVVPLEDFGIPAVINTLPFQQAKLTRRSMKSQKDLLRTLVDLLDGIVEVFLASVIEPLLIWHGKVDRVIDKGFRRFVHEYKDRLPTWVLQKGAITYGRMGLALPTMVLLSWDCSLLASSLVLVELAASFWERVIPDIACDRYCTDGEDNNNEGEQGEEESFGKSLSEHQRLFNLETRFTDVRTTCFSSIFVFLCDNLSMGDA